MLKEKKCALQSYVLGFSMHGRLTGDQRILDAGNELAPGIRQTSVISVYRGQGTSFTCGILRHVFTFIRPEKMCQESNVL